MIASNDVWTRSTAHFTSMCALKSGVVYTRMCHPTIIESITIRANKC